VQKLIVLAHHGLLRLLSYVLQTLSADQAFALCLNQSIRLNVPAKWAVAGTAADFLIVVSHPNLLRFMRRRAENSVSSRDKD
jgi:hypothetical protein